VTSANVTSANVARTIIKAAENLIADRAQLQAVPTDEQSVQADVSIVPESVEKGSQKGMKNGKWFQRNKWFMKHGESSEKKSTESPIIEDEVHGEFLDENEPITMDYRPRQKVNLSRRSSTDSSKGKRRARRRNSGKAKQLELYSTGNEFPNWYQRYYSRNYQDKKLPNSSKDEDYEDIRSSDENNK